MNRYYSYFLIVLLSCILWVLLADEERKGIHFIKAFYTALSQALANVSERSSVILIAGILIHIFLAFVLFLPYCCKRYPRSSITVLVTLVFLVFLVIFFKEFRPDLGAMVFNAACDYLWPKSRPFEPPHLGTPCTSGARKQCMAKSFTNLWECVFRLCPPEEELAKEFEDYLSQPDLWAKIPDHLLSWLNLEKDQLSFPVMFSRLNFFMKSDDWYHFVASLKQLIPEIVQWHSLELSHIDQGLHWSGHPAIDREVLPWYTYNAKATSYKNFAQKPGAFHDPLTAQIDYVMHSLRKMEGILYLANATYYPEAKFLITKNSVLYDVLGFKKTASDVILDSTKCPHRSVRSFEHFLFWDGHNPVIFLTFRGTVEILEWGYDSLFNLAPFEIPELNFKGKAHSGFLSFTEADWETLWPCVKRTVKTHYNLTDQADIDAFLSDAIFVLSGHSLGGAESQLVALRYLYPVIDKGTGAIYVNTWSSPHVFDQETAKYFDRLPRLKHVRFRAVDDIIPKLLSWVPAYQHTGIDVPIHLDSNFRIDHHTIEEVGRLLHGFLESAGVLRERFEVLRNSFPPWQKFWESEKTKRVYEKTINETNEGLRRMGRMDRMVKENAVKQVQSEIDDYNLWVISHQKFEEFDELEFRMERLLSKRKNVFLQFRLWFEKEIQEHRAWKLFAQPEESLYVKENYRSQPSSSA